MIVGRNRSVVDGALGGSARLIEPLGQSLSTGRATGGALLLRKVAEPVGDHFTAGILARELHILNAVRLDSA